jgi:hypothetical protein
MGEIRQRRRLTAWLGMLALLVNALAGAIALPAKMTTSADGLLGTLVICTADGARTLPVADGAPQHSSPAEHCAACLLVAHHALAVALLLTVIAFPASDAARQPSAATHTPTPTLSLGGIGSRAPPLSA